ncbi:hypothetical protein F5Y08DRAFT_219183 [Xylaria arbuscula]|nr:hypothetical protein F5Y08DRAFT_219183 [Xylaria arbuscula]
MKKGRIPATASFEFLEYELLEEVPSTTDPELRVSHNAFWSYCGPTLNHSDDLPPNFYEWAHVALSDSLVPRLIPFLRFVNRVLQDYELDHYWLTIRATKATTEFDQPRWHTDDMFFSARGGGMRAIPHEEKSTKAMDLQTDWKLCTTLLGPSTMFIPAEHQAEARRTQRSTRKSLATDHECTSIRCIACAATSDAVREQLSIDLKHMGITQAAAGECAFFRIGQQNGAVHSEPCMSGGDRIFVNVVPGKKDELKTLMSKWGMNSFPRSWWISPSVPRSQQPSLWKY